MPKTTRRRSGKKTAVRRRSKVHNRHRSRLLQPESLISLCLIAVAGFALVNAVRFFPSLSDRVLGFASSITTTQVLTLTNEERSALDLEPLQTNDKLNQAALAKAQHMLDQQYWSHSSPDGVQPWTFIKDSGYVYKYAGENLARDFDNSQDMVDAWMNSPTHRENIVNPNFTQTGLAIVNGTLNGFNTTLVVQMFASPGSVDLGRSSSGEQLLLPQAADSSQTAPATNTHETDLANQGELGLVQGEQVKSALLFSPLYLTKTFFIMIVVLIILTLVYDSFLSKNRRYERIVSQNFAHIMFFLTIGFLLVLFRGGMVVP